MQRFFLLTAPLLVGATASSCSEKQEDAASAAACTSAAASDAGFPAAGRGLLQVAGEEQSSPASPKVAATEGSWHSLLQGCVSRLSGSVLQTRHARALVPSLMTILVVACCLAGCSGLYLSSVARGSAGRPPRNYDGAGQRLTQVQKPALVAGRPLDSKYATDLDTLCPELRVPDIMNSVVFLNFIEAKAEACKAEVVITDQHDVPVLKAAINRPAPGTFPREPVVVLKKATGEELARCFLRQGRNGPILMLCDMSQEGGKTSALLHVSRGGWRESKWTLRIGNPVTATYIIEGQFSETLSATVYDDKKVMLAEAQSLKKADSRNQGKCSVRVLSGVDAGLVLCAFLGMGELESSMSSRA